MIRAGRREYLYPQKGYKDCNYQGFTKIKCLIEDNIDKNEYGAISPYCTKNKDGIIIENLWQFSKVYKHVPSTKETFSIVDKTIVWEHPKEQHINDDGELTQEYYAWRNKGFKTKKAVRYPVGKSRKTRASCIYALVNNPDGTLNPEKLDYIQGRKKIYVPEFCASLRNEPKFHQLKKRYDEGEKLLIIEVDGPHQESLQYYKDKYGVGDDFFVNGTVAVTVENMKILLNDPKHPFGHGYCLAMELAGITGQVLAE